jgi:hypothetical protein
MAEIFLFVALFVVCLYYEKKKNERKEYDEWLYCCRKSLLNIENQFRDECQKLSEEHLKKYTSILYRGQYRNHDAISDFSRKFRKELEELKENYLQNEYVKKLPEYLQEEYCEQIKKTYWEHYSQDSSLYWNLRNLHEKLLSF